MTSIRVDDRFPFSDVSLLHDGTFALTLRATISRKDLFDLLGKSEDSSDEVLNVVLKVVALENDPDCEEQFENEKNFYTSFDTPPDYLVPFYGVVEKSIEIKSDEREDLVTQEMLVLGFIDNATSLLEYFQRESALLPAISIVFRVMRILHDLHIQGWYHEDVHGMNILIQGEKIYLIDFQLTQRYKNLPAKNPTYDNTHLHLMLLYDFPKIPCRWSFEVDCSTSMREKKFIDLEKMEIIRLGKQYISWWNLKETFPSGPCFEEEFENILRILDSTQLSSLEKARRMEIYEASPSLPFLPQEPGISWEESEEEEEEE